MEETLYETVKCIPLNSLRWSENSLKLKELYVFNLIQSYIFVLEVSVVSKVIFCNHSALEFFGYKNDAEFNASIEFEQMKEKLLQDRKLTFVVKPKEIILHCKNGYSYKCWLTVSPINLPESAEQTIILNIYQGVKIQSNYHSQLIMKHIKPKISMFSLISKKILFQNHATNAFPIESYFSEETIEKLNNKIEKVEFGEVLLEREVSKAPTKQSFENFKALKIPRIRDGILSKSDGTLLSPSDQEVCLIN